MTRLVTALLFVVALAVAGTARADDTAVRRTPAGRRAQAAPVQVSMPGAVLRAAARRPGVTFALTRAPVSPLSAAPLTPAVRAGQGTGRTGTTFVDRITRSVSGERF